MRAAKAGFELVEKRRIEHRGTNAKWHGELRGKVVSRQQIENHVRRNGFVGRTRFFLFER